MPKHHQAQMQLVMYKQPFSSKFQTTVVPAERETNENFLGNLNIYNINTDKDLKMGPVL